MASNVSCVLFVLALVFTALTLLMFVRTCKRVIKCGTAEKPLTAHYHIFKTFYAFVWT